jgi:hypothetical protein
MIHPIYEDRCIRAIFEPTEQPLDKGLRQMVGHEFVWKYAGEVGHTKEHAWFPANSEDVDAYFEVVDTPQPNPAFMITKESELYIIRVEKLDG